MKGITPLICVTKMDLIDAGSAIHAQIEDYRQSGYAVFVSGEGDVPDALLAAMKGKVSVLCGQSGAGKSSLLNRIDPGFSCAPRRPARRWAEAVIRPGTVSCTRSPEDGWQIRLDSHRWISLYAAGPSFRVHPGFASVQGECRFKDCRHLQEPDCAVKDAVEAGRISKIRYAHYEEVAKLILSNRVKY